MSIDRFTNLVLVITVTLLGTTSSLAVAQSVSTTVRNAEQLIHALATANSTRLPTTIKVAPGRYLFDRLFDSAVGPSFLPPVESTVWLIGGGAETTTLAGAQSQRARMLTVLQGGRLVVRKVTISDSGGSETDAVSLGGGAAANFGGFLRIDDSRLTGNSTGGCGAGGYGGAILSAGRLHIERSLLANNLAAGSGGAIALLNGSAIVTDSVIRDNEAEVEPGCGRGTGGGIFVDSAVTLTLLGSTLAGNWAGDIGGYTLAGHGGGIYSAGFAWIRDSAIIRNGVRYGGSGGGLLNSGTMDLRNTTISGNSAGEFGGGIHNRGRLRLRGVTIATNEVAAAVYDCLYAPALPCTGGGGIWNDGSLRAARTVVARNRVAIDPPASTGPDCAGVLLSDGYIALENPAGCKLARSWLTAGLSTHDIVGLDPNLGDLKDTALAGRAHHPVLPHSPLIDTGGRVSNLCLAYDQLRQPRADGDHDGIYACDIGAIEYRPPTAPQTKEYQAAGAHE